MNNEVNIVSFSKSLAVFRQIYLQLIRKIIIDNQRVKLTTKTEKMQ